MKQAISILVLVLVGTLGCAAFPAKRTPKLDKPRRPPELREAPAIRLVVNDDTWRQEKNAQALERLVTRKKFSYLANAAEDTLDPDYTIALSVHFSSSESGINEFAYLTILVVPAITTNEAIVRATVTAADGRVLGVVSSTGKIKQVAQLHLLWVLPIAAPLSVHANNKMWANSFRDALIQAAGLIDEDQTVIASSGGVSATQTPSF